MRAARALLMSTVTAAAVVTGAGVASAAPVTHQCVECHEEPAYRGPTGSPAGDLPTLGEILLGVAGLGVLIVLW